MKGLQGRAARWAAAVFFLLALAGCGGGGGGGGGGTVAADSRNGNYTMVAADAREYVLALNFDARTYAVSGNGVSQAGSFTAQGDTFLFEPGNAVGATGSSTTRFAMATDTVIGQFALPGGAVPFIAARKFVTTLDGAVGTYDFLGRVVDTTGAAPNTTIQQAEITAGGLLRMCDDIVIFTIASCPGASVSSGTVTVSGDVFTAATPFGNIVFRVAQVGTDKVFLRASPSTTTLRRFIVGTPAVTTFTGGSFVGGTTDPSWGTLTLTSTTLSATFTTPDGVPGTATGTAVATGSNEGIRAITVPAGGYFATRSSEIAVLVAARGSLSYPGGMAILRKQ